METQHHPPPPKNVTAMLLLLDSVGLLLAIPILTIGFLLVTKLNIYCITFLEKPLIAIGFLLVAVSIAGLFAAFCRIEWLIWVHMGALFLLVILIFCFAVFAINITSGSSGHPVPGKSYSEYVLSDYPQWMRHRVEEKDEWRDAVSCMKKKGYCTTLLPYNGPDQSVYDQTRLSSIQSGCCKPPLACNFTYINAIDWEEGPTSTSAQANPDCASWSNDPSKLCYECSSCKAGLVEAVKQRWKRAGITLFVVLAILIILILGFVVASEK